MHVKATLQEGRLTVAVGDITRFEGEAIVNAANSTLLGGGGVDRAIHRAAGSTLLEECRRLRQTGYPDGLPAGSSVATGAGNLTDRCGIRHVIHTVGPVWRGGGSGEDECLESAYRESLALAARLGARTVAFPAISTGVYGFPKDRAARIALAAIGAFLAAHETPREAWLVFFSDADAEVFLGATGRE